MPGGRGRECGIKKNGIRLARMPLRAELHRGTLFFQVNAFPQFLSRLEMRDILGRNLHLFA